MGNEFSLSSNDRLFTLVGYHQKRIRNFEKSKSVCSNPEEKFLLDKEIRSEKSIMNKVIQVLIDRRINSLNTPASIIAFVESGEHKKL